MHQAKRYFLFLPLLFISLEAEGKPSTKYKRTSRVAAVLELAQQQIFTMATTSCHAVDVSKNKVIADFNGARGMISTSTLKLITTAPWLKILGKDFCFATTLQYTGEIDREGTLGSVYIKRGNNPTLGSRQFEAYYTASNPIKLWVKAMQAQGMHKIRENIIGDA